MNDTVDLTDTFNDLVEHYTGELGVGECGVVDLDAWATEDLEMVIRIFERAIEERANEQAAIRDSY
jgi:hypothetical protein